MHSILAARSDFSVGESILTTDRLIKVAKDAGEKVVALTDTMSVTGMIEFTTAAKKAEIKPVIGSRLCISDNPTWRPEKGQKKRDMPRESFLTVYALTEAGMKAIFRLLTLGNSDDTLDDAGEKVPGRFYYHAKIGFEDLYIELRNLGAADLAIVLGDTQSVLAHPNAKKIVEDLAAYGLDHLYAPLVPVDTPYFTRMNHVAHDFVTSGIGVKPLVVRPAFYGAGEADKKEIMTAISENQKVSDPWFRSAFNRDFHVINLGQLAKEMKQAVFRLDQRGVRGTGPLFAEGLRNTEKLVAAVEYEWTKQPISLPKMADDEFVAMLQECKKGWAERFEEPVFGHLPTKEELASTYMPRLKYELDVLKRLNFAGYFLLVQDVVQFAKSNGILVGPGRGSVGGSLVAYLMGITDCDPLRFGLLFERFINPERIDLPDADLDFMAERRHEVVEYLVKKYGENRVAGVSNFGKLAAASAIRDVGRVTELSERDYVVSKYVPKLHGANVPLPKCAEQVPEIQAFAEKFPDHWEIMTRLEGTIRNFGQHAAGMVVGGCDLVERAVVERRKEGTVVCWDKRIVEDQGLVKMDILGLNTLDILELTMRYVRERTGKRVDINRIPLDDPKVLENFAQGKTIGVFQFESGGMRRLLKELGADGTITFDDITAATALYRPGPMESGMMDSFYLRKQGNETIDYDHKLMIPVLEETFGVIVYQEQVMKLSQVIAGYSGAQADKLRKIMGKKLPEEMAKERDKFVEGCVKTIGCDDRWAGALFDKIEGFAGYGFNKSHSVEYTLISYQAMWLKTYYPVEFYAAALTLSKEEKLPGILRDAKAFGIDVDVPDINNSTNRFEIVTDTRLVMPFQAIKGVSSKATEAILAARAAGKFESKEDFLEKVVKRTVNVRVQGALDAVGAFARIEPDTPSSKDPSRIKDQIELLPGLITANVPVHRDLDHTREAKDYVEECVNEYCAKHGHRGGETGNPSKPFFGKTASFMIIVDAPNNDEDSLSVFGGTLSDTTAVLSAIENAGLTKADAYWTGLIKKPKAGKQVSAEEIEVWKPYLAREIKALESPVIVLLGTAAVRFFFPEWKGKASDAAGKVVYAKDLDANIVIGFNPGEIYFDPDKQTLMNDVFLQVAELLT